jgi:mono/diheme cytochrome c family protein
MKINQVISSLVFSASIVTMTSAFATDMASVERGRYLVQIAGCNDCHTPGYLLSAGKVDEKQWLTGDSFGWRGPWGTTYAPNLRLRLQDFTEDEWLSYAKHLKKRPPMPWYTVNIMKDQDLKDIYHYVRYMGPAGKPAPDYVPPDKEPPPPYALFPSPPKK